MTFEELVYRDSERRKVLRALLEVELKGRYEMSNLDREVYRRMVARGSTGWEAREAIERHEPSLASLYISARAGFALARATGD